MKTFKRYFRGTFFTQDIHPENKIAARFKKIFKKATNRALRQEGHRQEQLAAQEAHEEFIRDLEDSYLDEDF